MCVRWEDSLDCLFVCEKTRLHAYMTSKRYHSTENYLRPLVSAAKWLTHERDTTFSLHGGRKTLGTPCSARDHASEKTSGEERICCRL